MFFFYFKKVEICYIKNNSVYLFVKSQIIIKLGTFLLILNKYSDSDYIQNIYYHSSLFMHVPLLF